MTRARAHTLLLAITVMAIIAKTRYQLRERLRGPDSERGTSALEWAIIAAIVIGITGVVAAKVIAAVNTHVAQIK